MHVIDNKYFIGIDKVLSPHFTCVFDISTLLEAGNEVFFI